MFDEGKVKRRLNCLGDAEWDDRIMQQTMFSSFSGIDRIITFLLGMFADEHSKTAARMQERDALERAMNFIKQAQEEAKEKEPTQDEDGDGILDEIEDDEDDDSDADGHGIPDNDEDADGDGIPDEIEDDDDDDDDDDEANNMAEHRSILMKSFMGVNTEAPVVAAPDLQGCSTLGG